MKLRIFNTHPPPFAFVGINREGSVLAQEARAQLAPAGVGLLLDTGCRLYQLSRL